MTETPNGRRNETGACRLADAQPRRGQHPHADQIETLRTAAPRFARLNPFKVGDLVTPAQGTTQKWNGAPHLVIETRDGGFDPRAGEPGSNAFALVPDLRVLVMTDRKTVGAFWVRSEDFESYVAPATPPSSDI